MIRALYSAASGMKAQELNLDNIANNLANANTVGYKSRRAQFQDLMYQSVVAPGTAAGQQSVIPTGLQLGLGTHAASNEIVFTEGSFTETDNPLDLTIQGNGFFQVLQPSGTLAYTRSGQFQLDKDGNVVNSAGMPLQPQITIPPEALSVNIAADGTVSYTLAQPDGCPAGRPDPIGQFSKSCRSQQHGQQPLHAHRRFRRPNDRRARRPARAGNPAPGIHRTIQRFGSG